MILKAENIVKSYGGREILHGINLEINEGEFISIMGESGSGKSTLLNILGGNLKADSGKVYFSSRDITEMTNDEISKLRRTDLGFVFQNLNLISTLSVYDNIILPMVLDGANKKQTDEKVQKLADFVGISQLLSEFPQNLSGGERQRTAIVRAIIHNPKIIMLDEPTGSLDSKSANEVMQLLKSINNESKITVIQVTHSATAAKYGSRIIKIKDGQTVETCC